MSVHATCSRLLFSQAGTQKHVRPRMVVACAHRPGGVRGTPKPDRMTSPPREGRDVVLAGVEHEAFDQNPPDTNARGEEGRACGPHCWRFQPGTDGRRISDAPCEDYRQPDDDGIQVHRVGLPMQLGAPEGALERLHAAVLWPDSVKPAL